jgi:hypothetical protein
VSQRGLVLALAAACSGSAPAPDAAAEVIVAFSMDVHGELEPCG